MAQGKAELEGDELGKEGEAWQDELCVLTRPPAPRRHLEFYIGEEKEKEKEPEPDFEMDSEYEQDRQDTLLELAKDMVAKGHHCKVLKQLRGEITSDDFAELKKHVERLLKALKAQNPEDENINGKV